MPIHGKTPAKQAAPELVFMELIRVLGVRPRVKHVPLGRASHLKLGSIGLPGVGRGRMLPGPIVGPHDLPLWLLASLPPKTRNGGARERVGICALAQWTESIRVACWWA